MKITATERMFHLLKEQEKTKQDLADYLNLKYNTVKSWARFDIPTAKHLVKIAEYLNISVKYLLCGMPEEFKEELSEIEYKIIEEYRKLNKFRKNEVYFYLKELNKGD